MSKDHMPVIFVNSGISPPAVCFVLCGTKIKNILIKMRTEQECP